MNTSVLSSVEAKILDVLVARIPSWIQPDHLTVAAFFSAVAGGVSYLLAGSNIQYLNVASVSLFTHWITDSLDGRLARYRNRQRPKYGYYIDHLLDSVSVILFLGSLQFSSLTETAAWSIVMILMLLAMIHMFLKTTVFSQFELSLHAVGPTEARLGLIMTNTVVEILKNPVINVGIPIKLLDVIGWITCITIGSVLVPDIKRTIRVLARGDEKKLETIYQETSFW